MIIILIETVKMISIIFTLYNTLDRTTLLILHHQEFIIYNMYIVFIIMI